MRRKLLPSFCSLVLALISFLLNFNYVDSSANSANLQITCDQDPVYADSQNKWYFNLTFQEQNGVGFTIQEILWIYYNDRQMEVGTKSIAGSELLKYFPKTHFEGMDKYIRRFGLPRQSIAFADLFFNGIDVSNNPISSKIRINFSQTIKESPPNFEPNIPIDCSNPEVVRFFNLPPGLGMPKLRKEEVQLLVDERNPEKIRESISTVYDLLQYLTLAKFGSYSGDTKVNRGAYTWHFNRPGDNALLFNKGNCGASANVLKYVLEGDYEEVGFINYWADIGGHVFNYIKTNQKYYIIDLVQYGFEDDIKLQRRAKQYSIVELASLNDYPGKCIEFYRKDINLIAAFKGDEFGHYPMAFRSNNRKICYFPEEAVITPLLEASKLGYKFGFTKFKVKRPIFKINQ